MPKFIIQNHVWYYREDIEFYAKSLLAIEKVLTIATHEPLRPMQYRAVIEHSVSQIKLVRDCMVCHIRQKEGIQDVIPIPEKEETAPVIEIDS